MKIFRKAKKAVCLVYKRPKGFVDYCLDLFSALIKSEKALGMPVHITIEPTNICNLQCPICETGAGLLNRPKGMMQFEDFKIIIDKIHNHTNSILFYYMGEPFLNKDSYKMIRYAKEKEIYITTCTNGHFLDVLELINSGIDEVSFQIGGLTEESHKLYRVGSNLKEIIKNIEIVIREKRKKGESRPKVILGFIVMKQNESQIDEFYKFAKKLNVDEARIIEPCVRNLEQGKQFLPTDGKYWFYDRIAFDKGILKPKYIPHNRCNWIYFSTVVLHNGDVVPCCRDVQGGYIMGNILKENFSSIWNGKKYKDFRKSIVQNQNKLELCKLCSDFGIPPLYN